MEKVTIDKLNELIEHLNNKVSANQRLSNLQDIVNNDLVIHEKNWKDNVIRPFYLAYNDAFKAYTKALEDRENTRKQHIELAMFALSLLGGHVVSTLLSRVDLAKRFDDMVVDQLAKLNMNRTFTAYATGRGNPSAMFILNQSFVYIQKWGTSKVKSGLDDVTSFSVSATPTDPDELRENLFTMYNRSEIALRYAFSDILHSPNSVSVDDRADALKKILKSAFCRSPKNGVYPARDILAKKIELAFYMKMVLNSDYVENVTMSGKYYQSKTQQAINVSANSAQYPTSTRQSTLTGSRSSTVKYRELGDNIAKKINDYYKDRSIWSEADGSDLVEDGYIWNQANRRSIIKAEAALDKLNQETINVVAKNMPKRVI